MESFNSHNGFVPNRVDLKNGNIVNHKYSIIAELGNGTFGTVYKVMDGAGKFWALKVLRLWEVPSDIRKSLVDRFEIEYTTARINNPNIVHAVDYDSIEGNPYIVMEFCSGGDLCAVMKRGNADVFRLATDILNGLSALHQVGKVHRDLKPENVLIKEDGTAVLTDFGITGDRHKRMTERNIFGKPYQVFGTYAYMPPEQVDRYRGNATVLPTTDIFSFGVLLYQLITGVLPFGSLENQNDLVKYQKRGKAGEWDRERLYKTAGGKEWEMVLDGCLRSDFKKRLQSTKEVMDLIPARRENTLGFSSVQKLVSGRHSERDIAVQTDLLNDTAGYTLRVEKGAMAGNVYDLEDIYAKGLRKIITLGRDRSNSIVLAEENHQYISRQHLTIERENRNQWVIRDGQWNVELKQWKPSANGTHVNSKKISTQGEKLCLGDVITVGLTQLKVEQKLKKQ